MCGFINSDSEDNEGKVSVETEQRDDAMAKRNRKQESQAIKAMKQCGRAAQAAGAGIGASKPGSPHSGMGFIPIWEPT